MNGHEVLRVLMQENDAGASSIRQYLVEFVQLCWDDKEAFKRPFGNSGWPYELYTALARAGVIEASFDEDGFLDEFDRGAADSRIQSAIDALREVV